MSGHICEGEVASWSFESGLGTPTALCNSREQAHVVLGTVRALTVLVDKRQSCPLTPEPAHSRLHSVQTSGS